MKSLNELTVKIFIDGADRADIVTAAQKSYIKGLTTNPTLMCKAGVTDYCEFAQAIVSSIHGKPVSFEVISDDFDEMERQARLIAQWGDQVYVKIPVMNAQRKPSYSLIRALSLDGVKLNITALMTLDQVETVAACIAGGAACLISVFAGRVADTGRDPMPLMTEAVSVLRSYPNAELVWASSRELLNIFQADSIGCDIITVTSDILNKIDRIGKSLDDLTLDTVTMFYHDAQKAGLSLP